MDNFEIKPVDDSENQAENAWDMSDVESPAAPSEEERKYEQEELLLKDKLLAVIRKRAGFISETGKAFTNVLNDVGHDMTERVSGNFNELASGKSLTAQATLESFFAYADAMFPAEFTGRDRDQKLIEETESAYRRDARREGIDTSENTEALASTFRYDASENDLEIAAKLDLIKQDAENYFINLPDAIIKYVNHPNSQNRRRTAEVQSAHEGALSNSLYNIATIFGENREEKSAETKRIGDAMYNESLVLMSGLTTSSDEYYSGLMDYLRFKMSRTYDKYKNHESNTSESENLNPDVSIV